MLRCEFPAVTERERKSVCVSYIAVLLSEQQDLDALHVGAPVQQVDRLVQVILTSQRDGQLPGHKINTHGHKTNIMCI